LPLKSSGGYFAANRAAIKQKDRFHPVKKENRRTRHTITIFRIRRLVFQTGKTERPFSRANKTYRIS
jgi:hypothetical protein